VILIDQAYYEELRDTSGKTCFINVRSPSSDRAKGKIFRVVGEDFEKPPDG